MEFVIRQTGGDGTTGVATTANVVDQPVDNDPTIKAVTMRGRYFEDFIDDVHAAWKDKFEYSGWVVKVGEKSFIAQKDKSFWEIPYTRDGDNEITIAPLNEWTEMKRSNDFVAKNISYLTAIKSIGDDKIGAYGILWGDSQNKDLHSEYFTPQTAELKSVMDGMGAIPFLFDHGYDNVVKSTVIGKVTDMTEDEVGLWFEAKITEHELYKKMVKPLIAKRALYPSSGVLPAAKRVKKSGEITRWPIVEMTGTHRPAEHRMLETPISELNKFYKSAGLSELEIEADEPEDNTGSEKERLELELKLKQQEQNTRLMEIELEIGEI